MKFNGFYFSGIMAAVLNMSVASAETKITDAGYEYTYGPASTAYVEKRLGDLGNQTVADAIGSINAVNPDEYYDKDTANRIFVKTDDLDGKVNEVVNDRVPIVVQAQMNNYATTEYVENLTQQIEALELGEDQQAAVNSGITADGVVQIATNTGAITENTSAIATLNGNAETTGSVQHTVVTKISELAVVKPTDDECNSASNLCVLTFDKDTQNLKWVQVTKTIDQAAKVNNPIVDPSTGPIAGE